MAESFVVVGDGAMGTACALVLAKAPGRRVALWCPAAEHAARLRAERMNRRFLDGVPIPPAVEIVDDFAAAARDATAVVLAVPMPYLRATLGRLAAEWPRTAPVVSVVKGMERGGFRAPSAVVRDVLGPVAFAALSGPSHAEEVARELPAALVAAGPTDLALDVQRWFSTERFRVYDSTDLTGVELAGALKNVIAIAAGICAGLALGDNALSALITRGLAEIARLGRELGAQPETFMGLAGVGDLVTTCVSPHGRNRELGVRLAKGETADAIVGGARKVYEGYWTAYSVHEEARRRRIEMPVCGAVQEVLFAGLDPRAAVDRLMQRAPKAEAR